MSRYAREVIQDNSGRKITYNDGRIFHTEQYLNPSSAPTELETRQSTYWVEPTSATTSPLLCFRPGVRYYETMPSRGDGPTFQRTEPCYEKQTCAKMTTIPDRRRVNSNQPGGDGLPECGLCPKRRNPYVMLAAYKTPNDIGDGHTDRRTCLRQTKQLDSEWHEYLNPEKQRAAHVCVDATSNEECLPPWTEVPTYSELKMVKQKSSGESLKPTTLTPGWYDVPSHVQRRATFRNVTYHTENTSTYQWYNQEPSNKLTRQSNASSSGYRQTESGEHFFVTTANGSSTSLWSDQDTPLNAPTQPVSYWTEGDSNPATLVQASEHQENGETATVRLQEWNRAVPLTKPGYVAFLKEATSSVHQGESALSLCSTGDNRGVTSGELQTNVRSEPRKPQSTAEDPLSSFDQKKITQDRSSPNSRHLPFTTTPDTQNERACKESRSNESCLLVRSMEMGQAYISNTIPPNHPTISYISEQNQKMLKSISTHARLQEENSKEISPEMERAQLKQRLLSLFNTKEKSEGDTSLGKRMEIGQGDMSGTIYEHQPTMNCILDPKQKNSNTTSTHTYSYHKKSEEIIVSMKSAHLKHRPLTPLNTEEEDITSERGMFTEFVNEHNNQNEASVNAHYTNNLPNERKRVPVPANTNFNTHRTSDKIKLRGKFTFTQDHKLTCTNGDNQIHADESNKTKIYTRNGRIEKQNRASDYVHTTREDNKKLTTRRPDNKKLKPKEDQQLTSSNEVSGDSYKNLHIDTQTPHTNAKNVPSTIAHQRAFRSTRDRLHDAKIESITNQVVTSGNYRSLKQWCYGSKCECNEIKAHNTEMPRTVEKPSVKVTRHTPFFDCQHGTTPVNIDAYRKSVSQNRVSLMPVFDVRVEKARFPGDSQRLKQQASFTKSIRKSKPVNLKLVDFMGARNLGHPRLQCAVLHDTKGTRYDPTGNELAKNAPEFPANRFRRVTSGNGRRT